MKNQTQILMSKAPGWRTFWDGQHWGVRLYDDAGDCVASGPDLDDCLRLCLCRRRLKRRGELEKAKSARIGSAV